MKGLPRLLVAAAAMNAICLEANDFFSHSFLFPPLLLGEGLQMQTYCTPFILCDFYGWPLCYQSQQSEDTEPL